MVSHAPDVRRTSSISPAAADWLALIGGTDSTFLRRMREGLRPSRLLLRTGWRLSEGLTRRYFMRRM
jgi:hypothetical protein